MSHIYRSSPKTANVELKRIQGDTLFWGFQVSIFDGDYENKIPVSFSGYTSALMSVKKYVTSSPIVTYSSTGSTGSSYIDISRLNFGQIFVHSPVLDVPVGNYLFDLELSGNGVIETIVTGKFIVIDQITE